MPNTLLTNDIITNEALMILQNNLAFTKLVNREYDDQYARKGAKNGDTLSLRRPVRYMPTKGQALAVQDSTESSVAVVMATQYQQAMAFTSKDLTLSIDEFANRFIAPAVATLANNIDNDGMQLYRDIYNTVGTPGSANTSAANYLLAGARLSQEGVPNGAENRNIVCGPTAEADIVGGLTTLFNDQATLGKQYLTAGMKRALGYTWAMGQNVQLHQVGPLGGTPLTNGANQTGSNLVTDGWTAAAALRLRRGDVFTIAGVFGINPQSRQSTGVLRQFVVTADVSSDGAGNATVPISPAIVTSGPNQTVSGTVADNAAITVLGAANTFTSQAIAFHRDAFTFVNADLYMPNGSTECSQKRDAKGLNISIRLIKQYDINSDREPARLDVLGGWATIRPELACRIAGGVSV